MVWAHQHGGTTFITVAELASVSTEYRAEASAISIEPSVLSTADTPSDTTTITSSSSSTPSTFSTSTKTSIYSADLALPTYPWGGSYEDKVLYSHNIHRVNHTVSNLVWNDTLSGAAYYWATKCIFQHNTSGFGQNLAASAPDATISQHISGLWYNNEEGYYASSYGQANPPGGPVTGHFTQVVWKGTKTVGCATIDCRDEPLGMWYTVCNYYPPGAYTLWLQMFG
ncbi:PR-1-like protein [Penicillium malachiteum]|uniref:PR-1-like protein n=1 Tax=Penicillium malachiteum TaxID=1324776 RepID=UPI0025468BA1|nr:PR-1-like protein [Penicillium malachiteum]KAJ5729125.1 PR-1-like protein [Penicillium malachiteum]